MTSRSLTAALLLTAALSSGAAFAQQESSTSAPGFVTSQGASEFKASKFVGLAVYGSEGQKVGDIAEILIEPQGSAKAVVINVGGFLGMGSKKVALPWSALAWSNDPPPVQTAGDRPPSTGSTRPAGGSKGGPLAGGTPPAQMPTRSPAEQAAYNGYPNHATVKFTMAQLKDAPDFKYVADAPAGSAKP